MAKRLNQESLDDQCQKKIKPNNKEFDDQIDFIKFTDDTPSIHDQKIISNKS